MKSLTLHVGKVVQIFLGYGTVLTGPPSQVTGLRLMKGSGSVLKISWTVAQNECALSYIINTTADVVQSDTSTSTAFVAKPNEDPANKTYSVSVAAVDTTNRMGEWSDIMCFSFEGKSVC